MPTPCPEWRIPHRMILDRECWSQSSEGRSVVAPLPPAPLLRGRYPSRLGHGAGPQCCGAPATEAVEDALFVLRGTRSALRAATQRRWRSEHCRGSGGGCGRPSNNLACCCTPQTLPPEADTALPVTNTLPTRTSPVCRTCSVSRFVWYGVTHARMWLAGGLRGHHVSPRPKSTANFAKTEKRRKSRKTSDKDQLWWGAISLLRWHQLHRLCHPAASGERDRFSPTGQSTARDQQFLSAVRS